MDYYIANRWEVAEAVFGIFVASYFQGDKVGIRLLVRIYIVIFCSHLNIMCTVCWKVSTTHFLYFTHLDIVSTTRFLYFTHRDIHT